MYMFALFFFFLSVLASPFKSKSRLEAENAVLRHQLIVLRLKVPGRVRLTNNDRWFLIQPYRWFPSILQVVTVSLRRSCGGIGPAFAGVGKSRPRGGRRQIETELRALIRRMSIEKGRNRRLANNFEATINSARALLYAASVMLLVRRIARAS